MLSVSIIHEEDKMAHKDSYQESGGMRSATTSRPNNSASGSCPGRGVGASWRRGEIMRSTGEEAHKQGSRETARLRTIVWAEKGKEVISKGGRSAGADGCIGGSCARAFDRVTLWRKLNRRSQDRIGLGDSKKVTGYFKMQMLWLSCIRIDITCVSRR